MLVLSVALVSLFFGTDAVEGHLKQELSGLLGASGAEQIETMIAAISVHRHAGVISSLFGIAALLFGATGVFVELKDSMNTIWEVKAKPGLGVWGLICDRILSFAMVLSIAFLLLVSMVLTALLSAMRQWTAIPVVSSQTIDFVVSSSIITLLFMLIFKYLPDAEVLWKDVWAGALMAALLFTIGKYLLGFYLGSAAIASAYGAAASVIVFLLWTYYSSMILFFGAELTYARARLRRQSAAPV